MNRTEFETMYKEKYLNFLPEAEAIAWLDERRLGDGWVEDYKDDHLDICWRNYVMQCAIDDFCSMPDWGYDLPDLRKKPAVKALFDLISKGL